MKVEHSRWIVVALIFTVLTLTGMPSTAMPTPSKTANDQSLDERQSDLARIEAVVALPEVTAALAEQGFSTNEVNERLAQLSPEEIQTLALQIDQLQAAGSGVPTYIWILLGILIGVLILTAL